MERKSGTTAVEPDPEVDEVIARAQEAWDRGDPEEAGRILQAFVDEHPGKEDAIRGRGDPGPDARVIEKRETPRTMPCLRCGEDMPYRGRLRLHTGNNLLPVIGDLGELFVGLVDYDTYGCLGCGQVDFFLPGRARDTMADG